MSKLVNLISKIVLAISFMVLAIVLAAGPILLGSAEMINSNLGIQTSFGSGSSSGDDNLYFETEYETMADLQDAGSAMVEQVVAEGASLLKNENNVLPLAKGSTVNLYGAGSANPVYVGHGSGGDYIAEDAADGTNGYGKGRMDEAYYTSLTNAGLDVNEDLYDDLVSATASNTWYDSEDSGSASKPENFGGSLVQQAQFVVYDITMAQHGSHASDAADTAVYTIVRTSGEALDFAMDKTMDDGATSMILERNSGTSQGSSKGDALSLATNEIANLKALKALKDAGTINNIVVLINTTSTVECEFIDDADYGIDAAMFVGGIGGGGLAVGKLLTGEYNPSGKLSDTLWTSHSYNPVNYNFGHIQYGSATTLKDYVSTLSKNCSEYYVVYQEGIYNGYRYTETRYEDIVLGRADSEDTYTYNGNGGKWSYDDVVARPFGYGLSYSSFEYSDFKAVDNNNGTYKVTVDVTNNSDVDGKEAVQIYVQKPYTDKDVANGVEKAAVDLVGFDKVFVEAGKTETAEIIVEEKYLAAYDSYVEETYTIGSDDVTDKYFFTAASNSHDAVNNMIAYKSSKGYATANESKMTTSLDGSYGDTSMVAEYYYAYDNETFSTNEFIEEENENGIVNYDTDEANYGVDSITNQLSDVDFKIATTDREEDPEYIFSEEERNQDYMTRSDWTGTYGKRITLTATSALKTQQIAATPTEDEEPISDIPTYGEQGYYIGDDMVDDMKLIYLRGKDYNDELWDTLLNQISYADMATFLVNGQRRTTSISSIEAPSTAEQNGSIGPNHSAEYNELPSQNGFRGYAEYYEDGATHEDGTPVLWASNAIVAGTCNQELAYELGKIQGEYGIWQRYNGIYGLGLNMHRSPYNGRSFEFYSEDGFISGEMCGYQTVGMNKYGVFSLAKHAVLNDQETHRAGVNTWSNEQTTREIYLRPFERVLSLEAEYCDKSDSGFTVPTFGVMSGFNRMGARWAGSQGFINTVLRAEFGMRGFAVSDYFNNMMSTCGGAMYGNDLPDGDGETGTDSDGISLNYNSYDMNDGEYGSFAWIMRRSAKNVLYTVVNSNAMNTFSGDSSFWVVEAAWQLAIPISERVLFVVALWSGLLFLGSWAIISFGKKKE